MVARGVWQVHALARRDTIKTINKTLAGLAKQPSLTWDLSEVASLDHIGAQMFWSAWGKKRPGQLKLDPKQEELFTRIEQAGRIELPRVRTSPLNWVIKLGSGVLSFFEHMKAVVLLIGQVVQDVGRFIRHPMAGPWKRNLGEHLPLRLPGAGHHGAGGLPDRDRAVLPVGAAAAHVRRRHLPGQHPRHVHHPRTRAAAGGDPGGRPLRLLDHRAAGRDAGDRGTRRHAGDGHLARLPPDHAEGAGAGDRDAAAGDLDRHHGADRRHARGQGRTAACRCATSSRSCRRRCRWRTT